MVTIRAAADLDVGAVERIAFAEEPVTLTAELLAAVGSARAAMVAALDGGARVYGVTTGTGFLRHRDVAPTGGGHDRSLLLGRAVGGPPYLPRPEARALVAVRLVNLLSGCAGVTPALCTFLADRLNDGFVPAIPRHGIAGAGEVIPLSHAFQTLLGVGWVLSGDGVEPAAAALAARGVAPYEPARKEGIALLAGAPGAVALAVARRRTATVAARQLLTGAACSIDALRAPLDPYDAAVGRLAGDPVLDEVLARLRALVGDAAARPARSGAAQAPVSFRVVPQVHAALERTLLRFGEDVARAVTAVTDSPAFVDGRFLSTGGVHAVELTAGMDALALALVRGAELAGQRVHRLLDNRFSGLADQLVGAPPPACGLVVVHKRVVASVSALHRLAAPSVGLVDTSLGQEDAMTFAFDAAERLRRIEALVRDVVACELLVVRQAWALRGDTPAAGLVPLARWLAEVVDPVGADRPLGGDIERLAGLLAAEALPSVAPTHPG